MTAVGIVHPGEMGAQVGAVLAGAGHEVWWASAGRSAATARRAREAGLRDAGDLAALAGRAEVIVSLVPPHAALDTARELGALQGVYVEANAISPAHAADVAAIVTAAGATACVDGGVIGPPPLRPGTTRLYLSGDGAAAIAALFDGTALDARVVAGAPTAASALKMHYAAWSKGTSALLLTVRDGARAAGVEEALLEEWGLSQPDVPARSEGAQRAAAAKGWRWVGEMEEIAATLAASGLPDGFHRAAAEVYAKFDRPAG